MSEGSVVFCGHRPLGYVSNHVPLVTRYITRRKEHLIVTVSGRTFQTWGSNKLGLLSVSKIHPKDITSLAADSYLVFAAAGEDVYAWRRGDELQRVFRGHNADVHLMLPFGPHLITIDTEGLLKVWEIKTGNEHLEMTFNNEKTRISAICHPSTYIDKILVGSSQGHLQLWNLKSTKLIYTFKGWGSGVSCLQQAPAIDVVAIGLLNGEIHLHNLKYDETVIKFHQDWGAVTGLGFRTDDKPVMVSGSPKGHLAVWDLEERKLEAQMRSSHQASVTGLACLSGEPILVTSSSDNSVKQWIFDMSDGGGRLLRIREGHAAPPGRVRYYGNRGESLLSAGLDSSLRVFSTVADILHKSLGHASWNRKVSKKHRVSEDPVRMPPIVDFTTETAKDREWDNIAAIHRGQGETTTWSFGHSKMGDLKLLHPRFKEDASLNNAEATALTLTACGNFVLIGYSTGHVDRFNIQSGLHRGSYEHGKKPAHKNVVRGIATCAVNMQTITVDSKGVLKFWKFKTGALLHKLLLGSDVGGLRLQRESGLLALALEDFTVQVVDIDTRTVVRKFPGHDSTITDFCFSSDSRWLVTVSLDSTARVWELPTGHCIDYIAFDKPATSVDLSPASDMMATSHVGDLGVYLWINKSLYSHLTLKPLSEESKPIPLSLPSHLLVEERETSEVKMEVGEEEEESEFAPAQLSNELITLANLPGSRWLNLLNLDVIKAKNKPKAPPKKPKAAPFFLPTIPGLATQFDLSAVEKAAEENTLKTPVAISFTKFGAALSQAESEADMGGMLESLLELGPSAIDLELRSLAPEGGGSLGLMESFLKMIRLELKAGRNFEAVQSYLGLFLKLHGETVAEEEVLMLELALVEESLTEQWGQLQHHLDSALCLTTFFKSSFL